MAPGAKSPTLSGGQMSERIPFTAVDDENHLKSNEVPCVSGLTFRRFFSVPDRDPMELVDWERRSGIIRNVAGEVIFEQTKVEAPAFWSDMAVNVVASRYLSGALGSEDRETSIRQLLLRVTSTIARWGNEQGYFASTEDADVFQDELLSLLLHQKASFNSPVWFNVGVDAAPQCSACFILGVDDTMESILNWYSQEGMIFKGGSGAGVNVSHLRSSREPLSGGGTASGPISFMKAADASAGVIKSGGKTRRAAKMVILNVEHPDILDFIRCKAVEEKKAQALIREGYDGSFEGDAYATVAFQNSNHTVRVTDEFMEAIQKDGEWISKFVLTGNVADTFRSRDLFREMALAAHQCGDPGIQFDTTINSKHTCPETAPIRSSNPCSEYMHVDDSACNLSSLRLTAFLDANCVFHVDAFSHAIDVMVTAQDILVDKAAYPSRAIERNSRSMRALGLGYADLGGLVMSLGLPYDSDEGRAWASTVTALLTGQAYRQSALIASVRGPFKEFHRNRMQMLGVLKSQRNHVLQISPSHIPREVLAKAVTTWNEALEGGENWGFANCQVTVIAPTGTVAFMMDCDTTGIEPEIALVKHKILSGGGNLRIVNRTVGRALERLGYKPIEIEHILGKVEERGSIEGISGVSSEHLPVFDCAFRPVNGERFISSDGHLRMMAAVQPFISGGISKTVNLPADTTVEQIEEIFFQAWKLGLKSISVYRDGCKAIQPISVSPPSKGKFFGPVRRRLPVDCKSVRHKFEIAGQKGYIHTGFYEDSKVGEIFIRMAKEGSTISGLMDTIATLSSIALQYGVPLEALVNKFSHVRFEPSGFTSNPQVPFAKSLTDYIFRYLGTSFLNKEQQEAAGLLPVAEPSFQTTGATGTRDPSNPDNKMRQPFHLQSDAPACHQCGAILVRNGSCYKCLNCGATSGCS